MGLVALDQLRSSLRWLNVTEDTPTPGFRVFTVWPTAKELPRIEFVFDDGVTSLRQLGFGPWHGHFERWPDERRNVRRAVAMARALVAGTRCLLVERGAGGEYIGSGVYCRSQPPRTLSRHLERLERVVFNEPVENVALDMTRYYRTKRGSWIEHSWRARLKQVYAESGLDSSAVD